jgi:hypothetical protein
MKASQPTLPFPREAIRKTHARHAERLSDPEIAEIILQDIEAYGGEEALRVRWARLVRARRGEGE